jgi:glycosyltransferase involved in cell wall biosynthesis
MRILIIAQEPPFDAGAVATGNAIRTHQLTSALEAGGHEVRQIWLDRTPGGASTESVFRNGDQLRSRLRAIEPEALLVTWWELLTLLPQDPGLPVVLDFVAPRPLEELFEAPERLPFNLRRLRLALQRCDLILVGNERQESLLTYWLLEAGFDLRLSSPVLVVPLAGEPVERPADAPDPARSGFTLVTGGVDWPWRRSESYLEKIASVADRHPDGMRLVRFTGRYRWHAENDPDMDSGPSEPGATALTSYAAYSGQLREAHVGLELGEDNLERRFSQSFRSLDFLRHGLPLICSAHLPLARLVREYEAGWVVDQAEDLPELLEGLLADPDGWHRRSENAVRLVREEFDPGRACAPLLTWLAAPAPAPRLPAADRSAEPVLGVPPQRQRLARQWRLAQRVGLAKWFARRGRGAAAGDDGIVIVSRGDLFPTDHGAAVKIVETARGLSRQGRTVGLVTEARDHWWRFEDGEAVRVALPARVRWLGKPLPLAKLVHYTKDIPESNAFLYLPLSDRSFFWRTLHVAGAVRAGVLQAEFPAYAAPCIEAGVVLGLPTVLVEHNVEYDRLREQVPELTEDQYQRFRDIEIDLANRCDAVICVSDNDRRRLAEDGVHPGLLHTIPHGIDLAAFDAAEAAPVRERFGIPADRLLLAYHGTFAYPPNRDALRMLAEQVLPGLERLGVEAHVLAVGAEPPTSLHPRVHCTGSVEAVAPYLKAADAAAVALREGGGTRMKIIDYFAAGLPVVSTGKGIEGIPACEGREALIRDDWPGFCAALADVLGDRELRDRLTAGGRSLAENLDWTNIAARYLAVYAAAGR